MKWIDWGDDDKWIFLLLWFYMKTKWDFLFMYYFVRIEKNNRYNENATANGNGLWFACRIQVHGNPNSKKLHSKIGSFSFFILIYHHISLAYYSSVHRVPIACNSHCTAYISRDNDEKRFSEAFVSFNNNCIFNRYYKPYLFYFLYDFTLSLPLPSPLLQLINYKEISMRSL